MTFREKLADWISGGKLSRNADYAANDYRHLREAWAYLEVTESALAKIIEQEAPGANSTVKRMARIAREALES